MKFEIATINELKKVAQTIAGILQKGDVLSLRGDLGAGKTTFVQAIAQAMGIHETVTSPTFSLVNYYEGTPPLWHLDLYRLEAPEELEDIGYEDYFYPENAITFIEWAEKADYYLPDDVYEIDIIHEENTRAMTIDPRLARRMP